jgi:hypothetical protein
MRTIIHDQRGRDLWMVLGLVALAVGLPAIVGIASGAIDIPRNDDFAYRRAATTLYETGRVELTGWAVMTLVGQLVGTLPFLWIAHGEAWAFPTTTATFAVVGIVASYSLARRALSPGRAGFAVFLTILFPGFLLYTTAYMTDVPSFAMGVSCLALGAVALHRTPEGHRWRWLAASLVVGCYAVSIRELAIAAPVAVLAAAYASDRQRKLLPYAIACVAVVVACAGIYLFAKDLPGQGRIDLSMPTPLPIHRAVDAMPVVCLALAPALLIGALTWVPRWLKSRHKLGVVIGGLAGTAIATLFYLDQLEILVGATSGQVFHVFVGGLLEPHGSLGEGVFAGTRPILFVAPTWDLLALLALIATFGAFALLGATLVVERHLLLRALDFRSIPTPLGSVPGLLAVFVTGFTACMVVAGLFSDIFDRWMWPLALPLAILLLLRPGAGRDIDAETARDRIVRSAGRRAGVIVLTAALTAPIATTSLVLLFNAAAFDAARWRIGEEAVQLGFAPETVDAGFEWVGFHAIGAADPTARSVPSMTTYAPKFPSFHQCAVAASSPLVVPGFNLELTRTHAYRLLLFTGPDESLYLYRAAGSGCP